MTYKQFLVFLLWATLPACGSMADFTDFSEDGVTIKTGGDDISKPHDTARPYFLAGSEMHAYRWAPPWLPTSATQIDVVNVPTTGLYRSEGELDGTCNRLLLLAMPSTPMTGAIIIKGLRYRGVMIVGGEVRRQGRAPGQTSPAGRQLPGGDIFTISFDGRACPERPFVWISNILSDSQDTAYWGDFLATGQRSNATNDNFDQWVDTYLQKVIIDHGHWFWSTPGPDSSYAPHSDVFQAKYGGWHRLYVSQSDIRWTGQTLFTVAGSIVKNRPHPTGRVDLDNVVFRSNPNSTLVYPRSGHRNAVYLANNNNGLSFDAASGEWYSVNLQSVQAEIDPDQTDYKSLVRPESIGGKSSTVSGNVLTLGSYSVAGRQFWGGERTITFSSSPTPVVNRAHVGRAARVVTARELIDIFR